MDWDKLRVFHAVAEAGSFTHAGEILNLSQSSVSRQVSSLEQSLNVPLFHRHARGLKLTESGETLYSTAKDVFAKVAIAESLVSEARDKPQGPLRITTPVAFGSIWLTERLKEFVERYPDIQVTLIVSEDELDLSMGEADVAIRMKEPSQADLIRKRLMSVRMRLYASQSYLEKSAPLNEIEDIATHRLISQNLSAPQVAAGSSLVQHLLTYDVPSTFTVNNYFGVLQGVLNGLGVGVLPDYITEDFPDLVRVLPELESGEVPVFLAYPEELRQSKRISIFRDFVQEEIFAHRRKIRDATPNLPTE